MSSPPGTGDRLVSLQINRYAYEEIAPARCAAYRGSDETIIVREWARAWEPTPDRLELLRRLLTEFPAHRQQFDDLCGVRSLLPPGFGIMDREAS